MGAATQTQKASSWQARWSRMSQRSRMAWCRGYCNWVPPVWRECRFSRQSTAPSCPFASSAQRGNDLRGCAQPDAEMPDGMGPIATMPRQNDDVYITLNAWARWQASC